MPAIQDKFENVTAVCKANVFFGGKVVSHTLLFADGSRKTLGMIYPGTYTFDTKAPEVMAITDGECKVVVRGQTPASYAPGQSFKVPANSAFDITVADGITQYICSFE